LLVVVSGSIRMEVGQVGFWSFTVQVLSFGFGMRNLVDLLIVKVAALLFRNWLSQEVLMPYGFIAGVS
jgi:hypothetical protein